MYSVVNVLNQRSYIGRKYFWSKRKIKIKGKKRRKLIVKESDWRIYKSSCEPLKRDIEKYGVDKFVFTIISLHKTRAETNYTEIKEMFIRDVLYAKLNTEEYQYYNECVMSRYYRKRIDKSD